MTIVFSILPLLILVILHRFLRKTWLFELSCSKNLLFAAVLAASLIFLNLLLLIASDNIIYKGLVCAIALCLLIMVYLFSLQHSLQWAVVYFAFIMQALSLAAFIQFAPEATENITSKNEVFHMLSSVLLPSLFGGVLVVAPILLILALYFEKRPGAEQFVYNKNPLTIVIFWLCSLHIGLLSLSHMV